MRRSDLFALSLVTAAALGACSSNSSTPVAAIRPSSAPSATPISTPSPFPTPTPVRTPTPVPTATPVHTPTPVPTVTPTPTPTPVTTPTPKPSPTVTPSASPSPTAAPQVVYIGFQHKETTDKTYGPVYFYAMTPDDAHAEVIHVSAGSLVVFENNSKPSDSHTAGGFGSSGFPESFGASGNDNQFTQSGSTIEGNQWSTGTLKPGGMSQVFTVGPAGAYWFGCGYHYTTVPTASNGSMGDVLVSS